MELSEPTLKRARYLAMGLLMSLIAFSLFIALTRIYQVDEAQNVFTARILASHWEDNHNLWIEIWHLWPLGWLASWNHDSASLFQASRLFMLMVFWVNISLTALNCDLHWDTKKSLWILLGAATLAPLWDYGFEIRHDNLLLMFLLLYLYCLRIKSGNLKRVAFILGALAALLQFITFKSFVYWFPMAVLFLTIRPKEWGLSRVKTLAFGCLGFISTTLLLVGILKISGRLPYFLDSLAILLDFSAKPNTRFAPWGTLTRLASQTPMLLGVAIAASVHTLAVLREGWRERLGWDGTFPETFLVLIALVALLIHPMPLPYHLCLLVPFTYILGIRWIQRFEDSFGFGKAHLFLWISMILVTHVVPFLGATRRHLDFTNDRQEELMKLAEAMTDPSKDRVYDAAGLVASRQSIGRQWFLHTMFRDRFDKGELPPVRTMLQDNPASVIIPNYRFSWLQKEDVSFIQSNYLALANDFLVLGHSLRSPKLEFSCLQPGRYQITSKQIGSGAVQPFVAMDGVLITAPSVQVISKGVHVFKAEKDLEIVIVWVGPKLNQVPSIAPGDPNRFFINWY